jgi:hypothetical protein
MVSELKSSQEELLVSFDNLQRPKLHCIRKRSQHQSLNVALGTVIDEGGARLELVG